MTMTGKVGTCPQRLALALSYIHIFLEPTNKGVIWLYIREEIKTIICGIVLQ